MSYEDIHISQELSESLQRAVAIEPQRHDALGELVNDMAHRAALRSENPVSEQPTRHEVERDGRRFHTNCFGDALALPFVLEEGQYDVRSDSPTGGTAPTEPREARPYAEPWTQFLTMSERTRLAAQRVSRDRAGYRAARPDRQVERSPTR